MNLIQVSGQSQTARDWSLDLKTLSDAFITDRFRTEIFAESKCKAGAMFGVVACPGDVAPNNAQWACYFVNPTGSGKVAHFKKIYLRHTVFGDGMLDIYADGTVSANGTAISKVNLAVGNAATSVMSAYHTPTPTTGGTNLYTAVGVKQLIDDLNLILEPGHSLFFVAWNFTGSTAAARLMLHWIEY